jgi:hypothetical protein
VVTRGYVSRPAAVEQAIFTSARTDRGGGYQVVAASPGVSNEDRAALLQWGPSHDALLGETAAATSVNFHPLPSGALCISRTAMAGAEYSARGGRRLHTHCLLAPAEVLERFSNNPFALLRAAVAGGMLQLTEPVPRRLPAVRLVGRAARLDRTLLARLRRGLGADLFGVLMDLALSTGTLGIAVADAERLIAGLLSCLPVETRPAFSFSTGLRFSPRRPFRWVAVSPDRAARQRLAQQFQLALFDPACVAAGPRPAALHPWAGFVAACLRSGRLSALESELKRPRRGLTPDDLRPLGERLLAESAAARAG